MMGGGSNQSTQSTTVQPYKNSVPLLDTALSDALKAYQQGVGSNVYTGSTVIPFSKQTQKALNGMENFAKDSSLAKRSTNIIGNGGFTDRQQESYAGLKNAANRSENLVGNLFANNGYTNAQEKALHTAQDANKFGNQLARDLTKSGGFNTQGLQALSGLGGAATYGNQYAKDMMGSEGLSSAQQQALKNFQGTANSSFSYSPDFQNVLDASLQDAREGVNANASAAGRYGSGVSQKVMADTLGELSNTARLGEYRDWQNRKDAANQNAAAIGQAGMGNLQGALGLQSNLNNAYMGGAQQGLNNLQNAYGLQSNLGQSLMNQGGVGLQNKQNALGLQNSLNSSLFNAGQTGLGNMSTAYNMGTMPYQTLQNVGSQYEDLAGRLKNDELRIFNDQNNMPWNQINRLLAAAGAGGAYSTSNTTAQTPGQNPLLTGLGYGLGGLGLLGGF